MLRIARAFLQTIGPYRQLRGAAMQCRESRCRCCASSAWEIPGFSLTARKRGCRGISGRITLSGRTRYPKLRDHPAAQEAVLEQGQAAHRLLSWAPDWHAPSAASLGADEFREEVEAGPSARLAAGERLRRACDRWRARKERRATCLLRASRVCVCCAVGAQCP